MATDTTTIEASRHVLQSKFPDLVESIFCRAFDNCKMLDLIKDTMKRAADSRLYFHNLATRLSQTDGVVGMVSDIVRTHTYISVMADQEAEEARLTPYVHAQLAPRKTDIYALPDERIQDTVRTGLASRHRNAPCPAPFLRPSTPFFHRLSPSHPSLPLHADIGSATPAFWRLSQAHLFVGC